MGQDKIDKPFFQAFKWHGVSTVLKTLATFINMVVLARLLSPEDFGVAALVSALTLFFVILSQFGFSASIVQIKEAKKDLVDTVFTISFIASLVLYIILFFTAPYISEKYSEENLILFIRVFGIKIFTTPLLLIPKAYIENQLQFKKFSLIEVSQIYLLVTLSIGMALFEFHVWALLLPIVIVETIMIFVTFYFSSYWPKAKINKKYFKRIFHFGFSGQLSNFSNYLSNNIVVMLMSIIWPKSSVGLYTFSSTKQNIFFNSISGALTGGVLSIASKFKEDLLRIRKVFLSVNESGLLLITPIYIVLVIQADQIIPFVFGNKWVDAISVFQWFCLYSAVKPLTMSGNPVLYALGKPFISAKVGLLRGLLFLIVVGICYFQKQNLYRTTVSVITLDILILLVYLIVFLKNIKLGFLTYINKLKSTLLLIGLFTLILYQVPNFIDKFNFYKAMGINGVLATIYAYILIKYKKDKFITKLDMD